MRLPLTVTVPRPLLLIAALAVILIPLTASGCVPDGGEQAVETAAPAIGVNPLRNAYFGDLHIHTGFSFDAFLMFATKTTPDDAYRFTKGEAIEPGVDPTPGVSPTLQERAWSSPIWYVPE